MALRRDDKLRVLLPAMSSEYSFDRLDEAETAALEEAFGDGFGDVGVEGHIAMQPPVGVRRGLIQHLYYVPRDSEYDHQDYPDEFWEYGDDDRPPPSDVFPLNFTVRRLEIYFRNQLGRFCESLIKQKPSYATIERSRLEELANRRLYEKPWYEFHAVQLIDWMEMMSDRPKTEQNARFSGWMNSGFSGQLGRLVEQYYWRFRFEGAAITGIGARIGASAGGQAKARLHKVEHSRWQKAATEIWDRRPKLSKITVASAVKKQLRVSHTSKHIARFIKRP